VNLPTHIYTIFVPGVCTWALSIVIIKGITLVFTCTIGWNLCLATSHACKRVTLCRSGILISLILHLLLYSHRNLVLHATVCLECVLLHILLLLLLLLCRILLNLHIGHNWVQTSQRIVRIYFFNRLLVHLLGHLLIHLVQHSVRNSTLHLLLHVGGLLLHRHWLSHVLLRVLLRRLIEIKVLRASIHICRNLSWLLLRINLWLSICHKI
jgi:hypothetical protein